MPLSPCTPEELLDRIERLEQQVNSLLPPERSAGPYTVLQFARRVGRRPYTVREWARTGRIFAHRRGTGRGPYCEWVIDEEELVRYQQFGLLPKP